MSDLPYRPLTARQTIARALLAFVGLFLLITLTVALITASTNITNPMCGGTHTTHPDGRVECTGGLPYP